ncbi:MAG: agmatine deiminase family protein [Bacteroidota bacterium]
MRHIAISLLVFLCAVLVQAQQNFPKHLTEEEKKSYPDYILNFEYGDKSTSPPAAPPRTPGEFEETQGVIITWTSYQHELREIVRHARTRVHVYIITSNPSGVQSYLNQGNVPLDNISFVQLDFNSVWVRDFGPQSVYLEGTDELAFVDWVYNRPRPQDNLIPANMANYLNLQVFQMTSNPNRLVATGGNFMSDGHGSGFSSKLILTENSTLTEAQIDAIKHAYMGIDRYIKMNELPYDNISHLDMHMKLLDEETLLVGQFPEGVSDGPYIENNLTYLLDNYPSCYEREYNVVRVPMVPSSGGYYPPSASYRTFTNSLILNDLVLVPTYYNTALNQEALSIYQEALPGYEVVGINMENVIGASGAIHCITREIAANDPIFIAHPVIRSVENNDQDYLVEATIRNVTGITQASVFYKTGDDESYTIIPMENDGESYTASIPRQPCNTTVYYYISATNPNKTITKPLPGADGPWSFEVSGDAVNFDASFTTAGVGQEINFFYTGCLMEGEYEEVLWHFGEDAVPQTATDINGMTVSYTTPGYKDISLTIDGVQVEKENFVLISEETTYALEISKIGNGQTLPTPGIHNYTEGEDVVLTAIPSLGWEFDKWEITSLGVELNEQQISITMDDDIAVQAIFKEIESSVPGWQTSKFLFTIYPNPASDRFTIVMTPSNGPVNIDIFNSMGQQVYSDTVIAEYYDQPFEINLSEQQAGLFFVKVSWNNGTSTKRLILK